MNSLYEQLDSMSTNDSVDVVTITAHLSGGTMRCETLGGGEIIATGQLIDVGKMAYINMATRVITGEAPILLQENVEIF